MVGTATYLLKGYGAIAPEWMGDCLCLFRECGVTIRRLVLLQGTFQEALDGHCPPEGEPASLNSDCFNMVEIQFALPLDDFHLEAGDNPFLGLLEAQMERQAWERQTLTALASV